MAYTSNLLTSLPNASAVSVYNGYVASNAITGSGNFWNSNYPTSPPWWWEYDFGIGVTQIITQYIIIARSDYPDGCGTAWTFEGSNDNSTWYTVDTQSGITWTANQSRTFNGFGNTTAYRYYRLNFTASVSGISCSIQQIEMMADANSDYTANLSALSLTSSIKTPTEQITKTVSSLNLTSSIINPNVISGQIVFPLNLYLSTTLLTPQVLITSTIYPNHLSLTSSIKTPNVLAGETVSFVSKILSFNPILIVTNTSPMTLTVVDVTIPNSPIWTTYTIVGANNATDVAYNSILNKVYVSCADGKIVEFDSTDFTIHTIIDTGISSNLTSITALPDFFDIYAGTDYNKGEAINMYEGSSSFLSTDIRFSQSVNNILNTKVNTLNGKSLSTDVRFIAEVDNILGCDIRFYNAQYNTLPDNPIKRTDFHLYINDIEITDVQLDSIEITHTADEKSQATFILARKHDNVDYTLEGVHSPVIGHPSVKITILGHQEFGYDSPAYIWDIDTKSENEQVRITAFSELAKQDERSTITLSIPGINEKLHIYHALINNPTVDNPLLSPDDINPPLYTGIQIDPGYKRVQNVTRFQGSTIIGQTEEQKVNYVFGSGDSGVFDSLGKNVYFSPFQNFTYFWFGHGTNFITGATWSGLLSNTASLINQGGGASYLGTSPSSLSSKTWDIDYIDWWFQRQFPETVTRLGTCVVYPSDFIGIVPNSQNPLMPGATIDQILRNHTGVAYTGQYVWTAKQQLIIQSQSGNPEVGKLIIQNGNVINSQTGDALTFGDYKILPSISTKILDLIDSKLGVFWGTAPYKKVSCKSGILVTAQKWEDQSDGLYIHTDESYDYTNFVNIVGQLEYKKLQNINGSVLPKTKCDIEMFMDGYYFHGVELLKRINIDNTTQVNIYNGNNGFPVSVKSIHISSKTMRVTLNCSNEWSRLELLEIEGNMPDPNLYVRAETMKLVPGAVKFDPNSLTNIT